uniref:Uncharacterized protein n=1 Tax=Lepeophtheirus salmonis TaxID=72036 RepID=A0A0K2UQW2_LEPSM
MENKLQQKSIEESANSTVTFISHKKSIVQINVRSLINKFKGDPEDENVLLQFSNWKTAWENLVIDMKEMPGFVEAILFQKLKECVEEPVLSLVSVFASCSPSAYREAMKCLTESY